MFFMTKVLTCEQILHFKQELLKLRISLSKCMQTHNEDLIIADSELESYIDATDSAYIRSKQSDLIASIDLALLKIAHGTYGLCEETEEPIPLKRLEIIPYATCTVKGEMIRKAKH